MQKETDTEETIYYYFRGFLEALFRAYLVTILKALIDTIAHRWGIT
jgi:hypothetical protein